MCSLGRRCAGKYTFFGKAADMINSVEAVGRFQKIVFGITMWLLAASILLTIVIFVRAVVILFGPSCYCHCVGVVVLCHCRCVSVVVHHLC